MWAFFFAEFYFGNSPEEKECKPGVATPLPAGKTSLFVFERGHLESQYVDFTDMENVGKLFRWNNEDEPDAIRSGLFDFELPAA